MIDKGYVIKLVAMSNLTNQQISIEYNKFNAQPDTQVISSQIIPHVEKFQPQQAVGMSYDAFFYVKFVSKAKEIAEAVSGQPGQPSQDGEVEPGYDGVIQHSQDGEAHDGRDGVSTRDENPVDKVYSFG